MPQVPVANEGSIQRQQAGPNVRVSTDAPAEAFGGGPSAGAVANAGVQLGGQALQIAKEEKQKADDVATIEAYTKTVSLRNSLIYDPKTGAMNRKGKDALGVSEEYGAQFNVGADEIEASLTNDDQKAFYKKIRAQEARDLEGNLTRHTFQQTQVYDEDTTKASLVTAREDAVMNYQDPSKIAQNLAMQKSIITAHASRNGLPPEVVAQHLRDAESKTHEAVINRMLANGQDLAASDYYKQVKPVILGSDATQLEKHLEEGTLRGSSQRSALKIVNEYQDLNSALAQVDKIKDPKVQDATRERVKHRFQEKETALHMANEHAFHSAYAIAEQTKNKDSIPPALWSSMSPQQKSAVDSYLSKDNVATDWNVYYNLSQMAASPELREKFLKTDLMMHRHQLADAEFKHFAQAQAEARKGDNKLLDGIRTDAQIVNQAMLDAGIDPTPKKGSSDAKKSSQLWRQVDEQAKELQQRTGRKATNEEVQGIVDSLMIKGITQKGFLWDTKKRLFELEPNVDKKFEINIKDIPAKDRRDIEAGLNSKGFQVTNESILRVYGRKVKRIAPNLKTGGGVADNGN